MVSVCLLSDASCNTYHLTLVSLTLDMGYLFMASPESVAAAPYLGWGVSPHGWTFWLWRWSSSSRPSCARAAATLTLSLWKLLSAATLTFGVGLLLSGTSPDLGHAVTLLGHRPENITQDINTTPANTNMWKMFTLGRSSQNKECVLRAKVKSSPS